MPSPGPSASDSGKVPELRSVLLNQKFSRDLLWNYISLAFLSISGILINLIIAGRYGAETLGVFNQVYAVYIVVSQFSTGGIQYSALRHVAEHARDLHLSITLLNTSDLG